MFIGHSAVGFASKRSAPATNAGLFLGAAWLLDLLWPMFLLLGIEHVEIGPRGDSPFLTLVFTFAIGFWSLIVFLLVAYIANITGPPPPDTKSLAVFALSGFLLPLWGWWVDRHRARA